MKLAIQRLVRGDDGLTKIVYIDLQTLLPIADLTGYRIVNSGELVPEPVATVEDPETPSETQGYVPEPTEGYDNDSNPNYGGAPVAPNQDTGVTPAPVPGQATTPGAIRTPESNVPDAVSPPESVEPETTTASTPADLGPFGGVRTNQGSILPGLDPTRFDQGLREWSAPAPDSMPGNPNVSKLERNLENRQELENIKDAQLGPNQAPAPTGIGTKIAGRPETPVGSLPAARTSTNVVSRPETPPSTGLPAARESVADVSNIGISRNAYDTSYGIGRGAINAGIMAADNMATRPSSTISAEQAALPGISRNAYDTQKHAEAIASGMPSMVASRPERVGSLPAAGTKMSPTMGTKDDFAGAPGTTKVSSPEFDRPSSVFAGKEKDDKSVAQSTISAAKAPTSAGTRTSGFVSAANNPNKSKTTSFVDAAGYSQVDVTGNRGWRNNNPGNIEASNWTKSQPGFIGDDGRFAVFDTKENGIKAQAALLGTKSYANQTIAGAIARYAPAFENNTTAYAAAVARAVGVPVGTKMSDLTSSQRVSMVNAMHEVEGSTVAGKSSTSLTEKGIQARDNYTGVGFGSDTPSEKNAASRASMSAGFGEGGSRGVASGIGRNDSAGAGRGSSPGGPSVSGGIGRASSGGSSASSGGGNYGGGRAGSGKSATSSPGNSVSGASRSTAGKGGASPSSKSGGQSGAAQSGTSGKTGGSSGIGAGGSAGASQRSGGVF